MAKIQCIQRIPTESYAYIELNLEYDSAEEAFIDHERLLKMHEGGAGLTPREWTQVRKDMFTKGECNPELIERMNKAQRHWINETKLAMRSLTKE
jgi:hypothetical protein